VGRMGEIYGDADCGKTSLGLAILAAAQRAGGLGIFVETERTIVLSRALAFGVNLTNLVLSEPDDTEDVLNTILDLLGAIPDNVGPNVIVWDSIASAELKGQAAKGFGKAGFVGKKGFLFSSALPVFSRLLKEKRCALVFINQVRDKIGVFFGDSVTTPGGHAPKFQSSWRVQLWRGAGVKATNGQIVGVHTTAKAVKSKVCFPFRKAKLRLLFASGWDNEWSLIHVCKTLKLVSGKITATPELLATLRQKLIELPQREVALAPDSEDEANPETEVVEEQNPYSTPEDADLDLTGTGFAL